MNKDHWSLAEWRADDSEEVRYFRKNLAPRVPPGDPQHPWLAYLTFRYEPADERGFPSADDLDALEAIEANEVAELEENDIAVIVGVVLRTGVKDVLFYTRDPDVFLSKTSVIAERYPRYAVECEIVSDPEWEQYRDLP